MPHAFFANTIRLRVLLLTTLFAGLLCFLLSPLLLAPLNLYDEGIVLINSLRVTKGDIPYKDFWAMYSPGQFYIYALVMSLVSKKLIVLRSLEMLLGLVFFIQWYRVIVAITKDRVFSAASIIFIAAILMSIKDLRFIFSICSALSLSLTCILSCVRYLQSHKLYDSIIAVSSLGIMLFFRHDIFVYHCISIVIFYAIYHYTSPKGHRLNPIIWRVIVGLMIMSVLLLLALYARGMIVDVFNQLVIAPLTIMPKYRHIDVPYKYLLFPLILVVFLVLGFSKIRKKLQPDLYYPIVLCSIIGIICLRQLFNRADFIHAFPVTVYVYTIAVAIAHTTIASTVRHTLLLPLKKIALGCSIAFALVVTSATLYKDDIFTNLSDEKTYVRTLCRYDDIYQVVEYIQANITKNDYLYVGVLNHDKFVANDITFYYFSQGNIATTFSELHPGVANSYDGQVRIRSELEDQKVRYIILSDRTWYESNDTHIDKNINIVDDYIRAHYTPCLSNTSFTILTRR